MIDVVFEWVPVVVMTTTFLSVVIFAPLGVFRVTRPLAGWALLVAAYVFSGCLWSYGAAFSFHYWGWVGLIFGLLFVGVGVVPIGFLALALHSQWEWFGQLSVILISIIVTRTFGAWLLSKTKAAQRDELEELRDEWMEQ